MFANVLTKTSRPSKYLATAKWVGCSAMALMQLLNIGACWEMSSYANETLNPKP